jgi:ent-copalyl diphosphate synthase
VTGYLPANKIRMVCFLNHFFVPCLRIPKDMMHRVPTSILHSLEGMPELDWGKLLKLQSSNGSFLYSPSATAYALLQTGDKKCFNYIDGIVKKIDGGGKPT